jgi:hypothetical protein
MDYNDLGCEEKALRISIEMAAFFCVCAFSQAYWVILAEKSRAV